jgi:dienelactone hydrolase
MSPDGQRLAWIGDFGGKRVVSIYDLATTKYLRHIEPGEGQTLRYLVWSDNNTVIVSVSVSETMNSSSVARKKYEFYRDIAFDTNGGPGRVLLMGDAERRFVSGAINVRMYTTRPETVFMSAWDVTSPASCMALGSLSVNSELRFQCWHNSLFEVSTRTGAGKMIDFGTPFSDWWVVDLQGQLVARADWISETPELRIFARSGDGWKPIYKSKSRTSLNPENMSADSSAVVVIGPRDGDRVGAWRIPFNGGGISPVLELDEDVESIIEDRFSGAPAGFKLGGLEQRVHWLDPKYDQIQKSLERTFFNRRVDIRDRSEDFKRVLVGVEGPAHPPAYYVIDLGKGMADMVGEAYPELAGFKLGLRQSIRYKARDGLSIPAYLTLPPDREPKRLPLVVLVHDGPSGRDAMEFTWLTQFIASRGYAVLQPQYRGSTGFGSEFRSAGRGQWGGMIQDDITDGVKSLVEQQLADESRICIVGYGYGGFAALAGATSTPERYACSASLNGVSEITYMLGYIRGLYGNEPDVVTSWKEQVGDPNDASFTKLSPAESVQKIRAPILLIHAVDDSRVPISQSERFASILRKQGKDYELIKLPGEDHWLSTSESRLLVLKALEEFLAVHLRPGVS